MEENNKGLELAYKIGDILDSYTVGESLNAMITIMRTIIECSISDDFDKMKAICHIVNSISDKGNDIIDNRHKQK